MSRFFGTFTSRTRCIIVIAALLLAVIPQASANLAEFSSAQLIYSGDDQFIVLTLTGDYKVQPSFVTPTSVWTIKQGTKRYDVAEQYSSATESGWPRGLYLLIDGEITGTTAVTISHTRGGWNFETDGLTDMTIANFSDQSVTNPQSYQKPTVSITASKTTVNPSETIQLAMTANDPDGSIARYEWFPYNTGRFTSPTAATTNWTAPSETGDVIIYASVVDNMYRTGSDSIRITISGSGSGNSGQGSNGQGSNNQGRSNKQNTPPPLTISNLEVSVTTTKQNNNDDQSDAGGSGDGNSGQGSNTQSSNNQGRSNKQNAPPPPPVQNNPPQQDNNDDRSAAGGGPGTNQQNDLQPPPPDDEEQYSPPMTEQWVYPPDPVAYYPDISETLDMIRENSFWDSNRPVGYEPVRNDGNERRVTSDRFRSLSRTHGNVIKDSNGDDDLHGGEGDDYFYIRSGTDVFIGGAGNNRYVFTTASSGDKMIVDFKDNDKIVLTNKKPNVRRILSSEEQFKEFFIYELSPGLTVWTLTPLQRRNIATMQ